MSRSLSHDIRIIAGSARGRKIRAPKGRDTRPILARLKERLFSILGDTVVDACVWDVFAGSGALGLEALSRGARSATFVETGRPALEALRANLDDLGFTDRGHTVRCDAFRIDVARIDPADLAFCDPPFPLFTSRPNDVMALFGRLAGGLAKDGRLVVRRPTGHEWHGDVELPFVVVDRREHGASILEILAAIDADSSSSSSSSEKS